MTPEHPVDATLEGPEYLAWLEEQPEATLLMGANTYRRMSVFAAGAAPRRTDAVGGEADANEEGSLDDLTRAAKVEDGAGPLRTIGSISLCRSLLRAGLVDRFRVVIFPLITGATGAERIYDGYPDVAHVVLSTRTFGLPDRPAWRARARGRPRAPTDPHGRGPDRVLPFASGLVACLARIGHRRTR